MKRLIACIVVAALALSSCAPPDAAETESVVKDAGSQSRGETHEPAPYVKLKHPEWSRSAVLYQINTRQFTEEGTFNAARAQLPRIKELGADIIWLMPVHPIGEKNRKGTLGSPYSVKDYYGVNPEFGTLDDLKAFIDEAHALGMHVILDWVANHTAWDNTLATKHPDWYERDWKGDFHPTPWWDWSDIIDLNFDRPDLRAYMSDAMTYWVREIGVDGFRCDVAGYVPLDFWESVRARLEEIKPVFMLAEFDQRDVHARAFDASYAWEWNNTMHAIGMGKANATALFGYYSGNESAWPTDAYRMTYTSNHDQNAWDGTQFERFGPALKPAIVLSFVGEGIPLIYNGQEAGNEKRLAFFEKDPIAWRENELAGLFSALTALKHKNTAIWNGAAGARMIPVINSAPEKVLSFVRGNEKDSLFAVLNLSAETQNVTFPSGPHHGAYTEYFTQALTSINDAYSTTIEPWGYRIFVEQ